MSVNTEETVGMCLAYDVLVEFVTCAVAKQNIEWPAEKQDARPLRPPLVRASQWVEYC